MVLEKALHAVVESLKTDDLVEAIFLKGSMARKEHDNYSDIDLYCLVSDENVEPFLPNRIKHLESYKKLLFVDDIYIIAPQILAVYVDLVHIDLFTVTLENIIAKDKIEILYDPKLTPFSLGS
jgi:predicted nucleotidyltransferase